MRFNSFDFLIFLVLVFTAYWRLPRRGQNLMLLAASYVFYGWVHPWFLWLLLFSTVLDYGAARGMAAFPTRKRLFLILSLTGNIATLAVFKYFNFFVESLGTALAHFGLHPSLPVLQLLLPAGISFYTFQTLSYTIDVYRGELQARRSLTDFALFVTMFPQLVAGPIERATRLLPQIEKDRTLDFGRFESGFCLTLWGFFKKVVIADNMVIYVDRVFELQHPSGPVIFAGVTAFALQVFADFSAYTDIARGTSRLLGFELMQNFRAPYLATNPSDFWRRWHISLSTWIRDYIYVPLGGRRGTRGRFVFAIMTAMTFSGFWHGASWNFVLFGVYHGVLLVSYHIVFREVGRRLTERLGEAIMRPLSVVTTFLLILAGFLLFRQGDLSVVANYVTTNPFAATPEEWSVALGVLGLTAGLALPLLLRPPLLALAPRSRALRVAFAWCCVLAIVYLGRESGQDFIYFAF